MRPRLPAIVLIVWYALLGTGVVAHLHDLDHDREDAGRSHAPHDESNCPTHAALHLAVTFVGVAPPVSLPIAVRPADAPDAPHLPPAPMSAAVRCRDPPVA